MVCPYYFDSGYNYLEINFNKEGEWIKLYPDEAAQKNDDIDYGASTDTPLNLVETDISDQNAAVNDFSVKDSTFNTSDIVIYI